jgi:hypothetical protein
VESKNLELKHKRLQLEIEIARMRIAFEVEEQSLLRDAHEVELKQYSDDTIRKAISESRHADKVLIKTIGHHESSAAVRH